MVMGYSEVLLFCLSFKFKVVEGGATRQSLVCVFLMVTGYSEVLLFCLSFKFKVIGGGPTASNFLSTATKSNQKMPQPYDEA